MKPRAYCRGLAQRMEELADPEVAAGQKAYMRHQFEFYGLKSPVWKELVRDYILTEGVPAPGDDLETVTRLCFQWPYREMQYAALTLLEKSWRQTGPDHIRLLEELILTRSWWDTVDALSKWVGCHFLRFPRQIRPVTESWMAGHEMWLQRVAIIFQLGYREKTDTALLFDYIQRVADSREFFLQKAAGWALRQYARTDPDEVRRFVHTHPLPALTRREALKHL